MLTTRHRDVVTEAATEVVSLKKALSEAEHKAALELKERKKQEARVGEVQEELQELGKKLESTERELKAKEAELAKALTNTKDAKAEAERAQQEIQEAKKIAAGKNFLCKANMWRSRFFSLLESGVLQGHSQTCHAAYKMLRSSIVPRRGAQ